MQFHTKKKERKTFCTTHCLKMQLYPFMNPLSITHKHDVIVLTVQNLLNNKKKRNFMRLG